MLFEYATASNEQRFLDTIDLDHRVTFAQIHQLYKYHTYIRKNDMLTKKSLCCEMIHSSQSILFFDTGSSM